jgi:hypothetical protein
MSISPNRWLIIVGGIVVGLTLASVAIAQLRPGAGVTALPADTAEGVVQRYIEALQEQDYPLAHSYYSRRLQELCTIDEINGQARWLAEGAGNRRIELVETRTISDGRTQVRVRIVEVNVSPPFSVNEFTHDEWYVLVREGGGWLLDSPGWPVSQCRNFNETLPRP